MSSQEQPQPAAPVSDKPPEHGAGRPVLARAPDFDSAMAALKPKEAQFVRHVLAGDSQQAAYAKLHPAANAATCQRNASRLARRAQVAHALALGRKAGAIQAIAGLKYDVKTAHQELCERIDAADREGQHNAVASLMKLKLTLHKLDQPQTQQAQGVQIVLQTAEGAVVRSFGSIPAVNVEPIEEEVPE